MRFSYGKPRKMDGMDLTNVKEIARPVDKELECRTRPLPDWMNDPSLLPKYPPGRSAAE